MNKRISLACIVLALAMPGLAFAQYDFDAMLQGLPAKLDEVTLNNWTTGSLIWQQVIPNPPGSAPWAQLSATFLGQDHTGDGIKDDNHLALLAKILNDDPCARALLGDTKMNSIQAAFAANKARVQEFELSICLQIMDTSRVNAQYTVNLSNTPIRMANTTITTGQTVTLPLQAQVVIWISLGIDAPIPSLWGDDGILNSVDGFADDVANLLAAYLTIGDQNNVDYLECLMAQVVAKGVLPNIMDIIMSALGKKGIKVEQEDLLGFLTSDIKPDEKIYTLPAQANIDIDQHFGGGGEPPIERICLNDDCSQWIEIIRIVARIQGTCITNGINAWIQNYRVGENGFTSYPAWLAATGNLNGVGYTNRVSHTTYSGNRTSFLVSEWTAYPVVAFSPQPQGTGSVVYGGPNWNFGAGITLTPTVADVIQPTPYQWQWYNGTAWENISGATSIGWTLPLNYLGTRQYRVTASPPAPCCPLVTSNAASVQVVPPPINITKHPASAAVTYGTNYLLECQANIALGTLAYQWQKYNTGTLVWDNIPLATSNTYQLTNVVFGDAGNYRCHITSNQFGHSVDTNTATITISPPPVVITQQPAGANLLEGENYTIQCQATIALGGLNYQWKRNGLNVGVNANTYDILNASITDVGWYKCVITSDTYPSSAVTSEVYVSVVGTAFRVDKYAPRPGNNAAGSTWEDAFATIQQGIDAATAEPSGGEVWVAGGPSTHAQAPFVYNEFRTELWGPSGTVGQVAGSLVLKDNVQLYGGFEGYWGRQEAVRSERAVRRAQTIIDGAQSRAGNPAYHVVVCGWEDAPVGGARLDGFTIRGGAATGVAGANDDVYHTWRGGGIYNWLSQPTIANCTIRNNYAAVSGGGMANESDEIDMVFYSANARLENCVFWNNDANSGLDSASNPVRGGGGLFNDNADSTVIYCTFDANRADDENPGLGGAIYDFTDRTPMTQATLNSSIVWDNAPNAGQIYASPTLGNPPVARTIPVTYSCVQNGYVGTGNISVNPQFVAAGPEFYLNGAAPSPCINTGDPANPAPARDLPGAPRPQVPITGTVDMGAYEHVPNAPNAVCNDVTLGLSAGGQVTLVPTTIGGGSSVDGGLWKSLVSENLLVSGTPSIIFDCADVATSPHVVKLTLIDYQGSTNTCTSNVTITEPFDPVAICQDVTVALNSSGQYTLTPQQLAGASTDNCNINWGASSVSPANLDCTHAGTIVTVNVTVVDESGNSNVCQANVTVRDNQVPVAVCKSTTVALDATGNYVVSGAELDGGSIDNCSLNFSVPTTAFTCVDVGATRLVVLTVRDGVGNSSTCLGYVTLTDDLPPTAVCQDITVNLSANGQATILPAQVDGGTTDNCAVDTLDVDITDFDCSDLGDNVVILTATDIHANSSTCAATVHVRDATPANITLTGATVMTLVIGVDTYTELGAAAHDACDGDNPAVIGGDTVPANSPLQSGDEGDYTITYDYTDSSSNVSTQVTRVVHVIANNPPVITILGANPLQHECSQTYVDAGATALDVEDGDLTSLIVVGGATITPSTPVGDYVITYDVTDLDTTNPQSDHKERVVHVRDTVGPVVTLYNSPVLLIGVGGIYTEYLATASDACYTGIINITIGGDTVDTNTAGTYIVTYGAEDPSLNPAVQVIRTVHVVEPLHFIDDPQDERAYVDGPTFPLSATYADGFNAATYEWHRIAGGVPTGLGQQPVPVGSNTVELTVDPAATGVGLYEFYVEVNDDFSGATASESADVEIANHIQVGELVDNEVVRDTNFSITVEATDGLGTLGYQWKKDDGMTKVMQSLIDGGNISGATTDTLAFTPFGDDDVGDYMVTVNDDNESVDSNVVTLSVGSGIPAAGVLGLALLAAVTALGGAAALRRKK